MPRLDQVSRKDNTDPVVEQMYQRMFDDRDPVTHPGTSTGSPGTWWTVYANAPRVLEHSVTGFGLYRDAKLSPKLRELGQLRTGWFRGSQFVWSQHCKGARTTGLTEEQIMSIPSWYTANCYDEIERALLAFTDELVAGGGRSTDATFEVLRKHLSDQEIMEFAYVICTYDMHATLCRALRLEFDDVDERIVEVAAPEGSAAFDIGAATSLPK